MSTFLGKSVPHTTPRLRQLKKTSRRGIFLLLLPFMAFGALYTVFPHKTSNQGERAVGPAVSRSFNSVSSTGTTTIILADTPAPCDFSSMLYDSKNIKGDIFPFIPDSLRSGTCAPEYWDRTVFIYFILKILAILNWFAGAAAIILTVYAGLLYISGYAREENVKKAKTLLIGTYVGLIIVYMARLLVFGAVDIFSGKSAEDAVKNPPAPFVIPNQ